MPRFPPITLLIVNDKPEALLALKEVLQPLGVHVLTAITAEDGLQIARTNDLAVAVVDIRMPGTDGFAMVEQIRADRAMKGLPVIFVSAEDPTPQIRERVFELGAADFVPVPVSATELRSKVALFVDLHRKNHELAERTRAVAREQLKASEQKFREIFETAHEGIWIIDDDARVELVNGRMGEILGYAPDEMVGRRKSDFAFPEDAEYVRKLFEQRRRGAADTVEVRFRRKDGEPVWLLLSARPLYRDGRFSGALDMFTDISARKRAAEQFEKDLRAQVAQRTRALEEKTRQLESFAYTIAHDLRSPLRAISGYAELTMDDFGPHLPPEVVANLHKIRASASRLDELIRDLLSYARVSQVEYIEQDVPLAASVEWALDQLRSDIQARAGNVHVPPDLPVVRGERSIVDQMVLNLLSNAVKFVPPNVPPEVVVSAVRTDGVVRLCIRDNGIGIPPEYHERIFRVFERLQGQHRVPGTGVGLAIVARAAERLGGRVGLESQPGRGSTFWVELKPSLS